MHKDFGPQFFWYEHVYFAKYADILLYWQYISLEFQEFKRIVTGMALLPFYPIITLSDIQTFSVS